MPNDTTISFDVDGLVDALAKTIAEAMPGSVNIYDLEVVIRTGMGVVGPKRVVIRATIGVGCVTKRLSEISGVGESIGAASIDLHTSASAWARRTGKKS